MSQQSWDLEIDLRADSERPLFLQIAQAVSHAIEAGRLRAAERLPGSRRLAQRLEVHRNTVLAAYGELSAQGWIVQQEARGTFVAQDIPKRVRASSGHAMAVEPGYELLPDAGCKPPETPGLLPLGGGMPDPRLIPCAEIGRAYRRALAQLGEELLDYGDPRGYEGLREALCVMLRARRGLVLQPEELLLTRGAQMALYLAGRLLLRPGDSVAVEEFGYPPAWQAFRAMGAQLLPLQVDAAGARIEDLAQLCAGRPPRAVYLTPHHQFPTMAVLSAGRRLRLLELARQYGLAVIEDDYDNEFHYQGRPVLPVAAADRAGSVLYVGSLSKVLAPGLRIGYLAAPRPVIERLAALRRGIDRQGDGAAEAAVADLLESGLLARHIRKMRRKYQARRDVLLAELAEKLPEALQFEVPAGGLSLWATVAAGIDPDAWVAAGRERGVAFQAASSFSFDGRPRGFVRLGFARLQPAEIRRAVGLLAEALQLSLQS